MSHSAKAIQALRGNAEVPTQAGRLESLFYRVMVKMVLKPLDRMFPKVLYRPKNSILFLRCTHREGLILGVHGQTF